MESVETLHSSSNKLSAVSRCVCVCGRAGRAAGLRGCLACLAVAHSGPSVMSHAIGHGAVAATFPAGVCRARDKAAGAATLLRKVCVCKTCQTHLDIAVRRAGNRTWLCTLSSCSE